MRSLSEWSQSKWGRLLAWICLLAAVVDVVEIGLIMLTGGDWKYGSIQIGHPRTRLFAVCVFLFVWYLLRYGLSQGRREWGPICGPGHSDVLQSHGRFVCRRNRAASVLQGNAGVPIP